MASFAEWHLIQFTADMRRREPRNIGVAATDGESWQLRLFGVDPHTSAIDGRSLRRMQLAKDDYAAWVQYYTLMLNDGGPARIRDSQRRHPKEFRLIAGGHTEMYGSLRDLADRLYVELVEDTSEKSSENHSKELASKVEQVLHTADITPSPQVVVPGKWGDATDDIPFDYAFMNGQRHLMDRLQLHQATLEQSKMVARDFNARVRAVREAGSAESFVAFYSQSAVDELGTDSVLAPLWRVAHTVDVDNVSNAARDLRDFIYAA